MLQGVFQCIALSMMLKVLYGANILRYVANLTIKLHIMSTKAGPERFRAYDILFKSILAIITLVTGTFCVVIFVIQDINYEPITSYDAV